MKLNWINSFSETLSDSLNPVFVKEFRQMLRGRCLRFSLGGLLIGQGLGFYLLWHTTTSFERNAIWIFYGLLLFGMIWWLLGDGVSRWTHERAIDGITPEFTTTLSPDTIVSGKLLALLAGGVMLLLLGLPMAAMAIGYLWEVGGTGTFDLQRLFWQFMYLLWIPVGVLIMMELGLMTGAGRKNGWSIAVIVISMFFWIHLSSQDRVLEDAKWYSWIEGMLNFFLLGVILYFSCAGKLLSPTVDRLRRSHLAIIIGFVAMVIFGLLQKDNSVDTFILFLAVCAIFPGLDELRQSLPGRTFGGNTVRAMALAFLVVALGSGLLVDWRSDSPDIDDYGSAFLVLFYAEIAVLLRQLKVKTGPFALFFIVAAAGNLMALPATLLAAPGYCVFSPAIMHYWKGIDGLLWCGGLALTMLILIAARWYFSLPVRQKA